MSGTTAWHGSRSVDYRADSMRGPEGFDEVADCVWAKRQGEFYHVIYNPGHELEERFVLGEQTVFGLLRMANRLANQRDGGILPRQLNDLLKLIKLSE